jgi:cell division septal protein FtsQ
MSTDILLSSRRKRRKKIFLKAGLVLAGIFLFLGGVVAFFYIPKFRINNISIEGTDILDERQLKEEISFLLKEKIFKILPCDNIFILPKAKITSELLRKFPILKEISIIRIFPQKISVFLEEREPKALWCIGLNATTTEISEVSCAFVDEKGFIFQPAPSFSGAIFVKFFDKRQEPADIGKEMMSESEFQNLDSFAELLNRNNIDVSEILLKDDGEYEVYLKEGWHIKLNSKNEAILSFNNLQLVLNEKIKEKRPALEYIDLRFGRKVFYKLK